MCIRRYEMNWITHKPSFEFDNFSHIIRSQSAWSRHLDFAYDLVRFEKPETLVELGTYLGASFFSFCQGVKDGGLFPKGCSEKFSEILKKKKEIQKMYK